MLIPYEILPNLETWLIEETLLRVPKELIDKHDDLKTLFTVSRSHENAESFLQSGLMCYGLRNVDWNYINLKFKAVTVM